MMLLRCLVVRWFWNLSDDQTEAIVVDASGNAIIAGYSTGTNTTDCVTIKYAAPAPPAGWG